VGLVGGVACGKSMAASFFRQLGARCVDADSIARQVLGRPAVRRALARAFGPSVVAGGRIDRRGLAEKAFRTGRSVRRLNAIVHPHIAREMRRRIRAARGVVLVDAPLLQEAGIDGWCDAVVYVDAPRRQRAARAAARGWPPGELARRERLQWSAARKRAGADHVVDNGGTKAAARRQIGKLYREFIQALQE